MRSFLVLNIREKCRRRALRFRLLVSFLPENSLPIKELFVGNTIGFAPCSFRYTDDDSWSLFVVYFEESDLSGIPVIKVEEHHIGVYVSEDGDTMTKVLHGRHLNR